jgi:hypothetical protein
VNEKLWWFQDGRWNDKNKKNLKIKTYNCAVILQSFETYCPTLRAPGVSEQWWVQYSNQSLQLQLWHVGNYTSQCFAFCNSSCSSATFTTLCGLWLSRPDHSKSCYSKPVISNYSHPSASCDSTRHPAIVFLVFLSVGSPLVYILIFHLPFLKSPYSVSGLTICSLNFKLCTHRQML